MNDRTNQIIVGVGIVILFIGAWYVGRMQTKGPAGSAASSSMAADSGSVADTASRTKDTGITPSTAITNESVTVVDQPAGGVVKITSVTLAQLGWVAVRDSNGRVLGAGRFEAGTSKNVVVELLRNTVARQKYQVLLYVDDGDKLFDLHKDSLVMNADASVAGAVFTAH